MRRQDLISPVCLKSVFQWLQSCRGPTVTVTSTHQQECCSSTFWKESTSKESFLHTQNQVHQHYNLCHHLSKGIYKDNV